MGAYTYRMLHIELSCDDPLHDETTPRRLEGHTFNCYEAAEMLGWRKNKEGQWCCPPCTGYGKHLPTIFLQSAREN